MDSNQQQQQSNQTSTAKGSPAHSKIKTAHSPSNKETHPPKITIRVVIILTLQKRTSEQYE